MTIRQFRSVGGRSPSLALRSVQHGIIASEVEAKHGLRRRPFGGMESHLSVDVPGTRRASRSPHVELVPTPNVGPGSTCFMISSTLSLDNRVIGVRSANAQIGRTRLPEPIGRHCRLRDR